MAFKENSGAYMLLPDQIIDGIVAFNGLFRKVFGELHDDIVYDKEAEFCRRALREIFLFKDSDQIFPKVLQEKRFHKTLDTVFRYMRPEPEKTLLGAPSK